MSCNFLSEKARKLTPYIAGIQPRGNGWVKLNTNENPYPPSPWVVEALNGADIAKLRLYPDGDSVALKTAIAETLNAELCEGTEAAISPDNIFCANSSDEVLALAFQAFFSGKSNVVTPDISYGFYPVWGEMYDVNFTYAPLNKDFTVNLDDYKNTNGVVIANPNAPTSLALAFDDFEKSIASNENSVFLVDEAYIAFSDRVENKSVVSLVNKYKNLLVVRTFSKSHSLAGLRVGYAVGSAELVDGLRRVRDAFNSYPLGMLAQIGATASIKDVEYLKETTTKIIKTREKTIAEFKSLGYEVLPSQANFIFMHDTKTENASGLYRHLLENKILVRHWNKPRLAQHLRISIGTDTEMEAVINCVKKYNGGA